MRNIELGTSETAKQLDTKNVYTRSGVSKSPLPSHRVRTALRRGVFDQFAQV